MPYNFTKPAWFEQVRRVAPWYAARLDEHAVRSAPAQLSKEELVAILGESQDRMGDARADSTWSNMASVINPFAAFDATQKESSYQLLPLDMRMVVWLQHRLRQGLELSSVVIYYRRLHGVYRLLQGCDSLPLQEFGRGLQRDPDSVPRGTRALTREELKTVLEFARTVSLQAYCQVYTMYVLASRTDDVNRLRWEDVTLQDDLVICRWDRGTKSGPDRRLDLIPAPPNALVDLLSSAPARESSPDGPFSLPCDRITLLIRRALGLSQSDPDWALVSSHCLKKTALVRLLENNVPIYQVQFKAKHATPDMLQTYVGSEAWSVAHDALSMSHTLAEDLSAPQ
jgi:integrase